jgi:hypothetical protein
MKEEKERKEKENGKLIQGRKRTKKNKNHIKELKLHDQYKHFLRLCISFVFYNKSIEKQLRIP